MAVPSYTTDLALVSVSGIEDADADDNDGWYEMTGHTSGGADTPDTDYYIQGIGCVSQSLGAKTGTQVGLEFRSGVDETAFVDDTDVFFIWHVMLAGNSMESFANGGMRIYIGSSTGNVYGWKTGGVDFGRNPYGGWHNVAVDPQHAVDYTEGTPTASNYQIYCSLPNLVSAISKGNLHGMDAIRFGRGDFIVTDGQAADYATFVGMAQENDYNDITNGYNSWGLFQAEGTGYLWKGLMSLGTSATAVDFRDTNRNITVDVVPRVYAGFNKIEITNAGSNVEWTGVNITSLTHTEQKSPGSFEMIDDATVSFTTCVFTDMTTFIFDSNATLDAVTFRRCALVTQAGGTFDNCIFDESTGLYSITSDNISLLDGCNFASDGSNHAIYIPNGSTGSFNLTNHTFSGYATVDGDTGNEVIYNDSGGAVTLNASGNTGTISVRNGTSATTTVIEDPVTLQITVKDLSTGLDIESAKVLVWVTDSANYFYQASVAITGSGTTATVTQTSHGLITGDKVIIGGVTNDDDYNGVFSITVLTSSTYTYTTTETLGVSPATGTPVATLALISADTNASGIVSDSRVLGSSQPISGWIRKSSGSPYYSQGVVTGTVSNATGLSIIVQLARDE